MSLALSKACGLICFGCLAFLPHASVEAQQRTPAIELTKTRERAKAVIDLVSPTIVRFAYGDERKLQFGCGVIVSAAGHVVVSGPVHAVVDDDLLELRLIDGRRVRGKALGWSGESGFGMLKITDAGELPHVDLSKRAKAGEVCVALGYSRNSAEKETRPSIRLGIITKVADGHWFTTSYRSQFNAHPVFNLDGELLGLNCSTPVGGDPLHASAALIEAYWDDLASGRNLDRVRLFSDEGEPRQSTDPQSEEVAPTVIEKAKAASVRISDVGEDVSLVSGVIATPDGYVITCGHHGRMPGEKMTLSLHDGRSANAMVLGANLVSDVGVLKITDEGTWPYAEMGRSAAMSSGDHCVVIGYSTKTQGNEPLVLASQIIEPTQTLPRRDEFYCEFWTSNYPEEPIGGASGGGVFDAQGRVIGVLLGGAGKEMQHSRVELFHKNWDVLTANEPVRVVDAKWLADATASLNRIADELSAELRHE